MPEAGAGTATATAPQADDSAAPAPAAPAPAKPTTPSDMPDAEDRHRSTARQYDLAAHRGKWVVVNFWATWCKPCLKEMPELSALDAMREHIEVIGLAYEEIEPADMRAFLKKHPVAYPIAIVDTYDPPADFETPRGLPMTYLIAPDGKVADQFLGPVDRARHRSGDRQGRWSEGRSCSGGWRAMSAARFIVSGRVQGVWFRASTREQALALGLRGFARNLPDGRVEVLAAGDDAALDRLAAWLRQGPPLARGRRPRTPAGARRRSR